ncbi:hypothetical protein B0H14DRAFT_2602808 [Mycena olivaceomarginata]|nr:hypothetical protein B0H14DRAFT_2602808 [Mycena olivaceomarginata]
MSSTYNVLRSTVTRGLGQNFCKKYPNRCGPLGNGWKPTVWTRVVNNVQAEIPMHTLQRTRLSVRTNCNMYFFSLLYVFVAKFSGTGWDNDEKHATNTAEYIADFLKVCGPSTFPGTWYTLL